MSAAIDIRLAVDATGREIDPAAAVYVLVIARAAGLDTFNAAAADLIGLAKIGVDILHALGQD
jgi:hypothetical protein